MIIDREDKAPLDSVQLLCHAGEVRAHKPALAVVGLIPPVGRVEIKQRIIAVITGYEGRIIKAFNDNPRQTPMQILEHRLKRGEVEAGGSVFCHTEIAPRRLAPEGGALKVEEPRGPFEIGEGARVGIGQADELGACGQLKSQHFEELGIVTLQYPEKIADVTAKIIDDLGFGPHGAAQEYPAHADKGLGIGQMPVGIGAGADAPCEIVFAARIGGHGADRIHRGQMTGGGNRSAG